MNYEIQRLKKLQHCLIPLAENVVRQYTGKPEQEQYRLKLEELRLESKERLEKILRYNERGQDEKIKNTVSQLQ